MQQCSRCTAQGWHSYVFQFVFALCVVWPSNHHHPPPHPTCRFCACLSALLSASARGYGRDLRSAAAAVLADTPSMCPLPRLRAIAPSMAACALSRISSPFARMLHIVSHCPARREAAFSPLSMLQRQVFWLSLLGPPTR